jgi:hypothetical protein
MTTFFSLQKPSSVQHYKTLKIKYNILQLYSLYVIPYDLKWLLQCKIYINFIPQHLYETIYNSGLVDVLAGGYVQIVYK